ncbi:hypothetical protein PHPALM_29084 [Phytophthora palmivora]|uniref:Uncharacterized protein n=1 Tax=Phytophthora palmivora TaxID=4796 RepID=A0A2P4X8G7_9STRA|nr:hypothetical protein PHPALM_29084 [Phytophthora palmivora]
MSNRVWQVAGVTAVVVPLVCWQYRRYNELKERSEAMKLLRKVELIATEVSVRLMHLETQAKELVEYEAKKEAGEMEEEDPAANSTLNSYYHFDSQGNKLKTKWDSYDVDAELERLEKEERGEEVSTAATVLKKPMRKVPQITRSKALAASQGIEHEFEAVLSFLDDIRGDNEVKQLRKAITNKVTKEYFARIDAIQAMLAEHEEELESSSTLPQSVPPTQSQPKPQRTQRLKTSTQS